MLQSRFFKITELVFLFLVLPISLALGLPPFLDITITIIGIGYCVWISIKLKLLSSSLLKRIDLRPQLQRIGLNFLIVVVTSLLFMSLFHPEDLFLIVKKKPFLWLSVLVFYAVFSVLPQELLYRSYFFQRYEGIFNKKILMLINVAVFPIAHLFFDNPLVLIVTLIGGVLFTFTYHRTKSLLITSIEHALYGNWLFTVGMGEMLAFPMPH